MTLFYSDFSTASSTGLPGFDILTGDTTGKYGFNDTGSVANTDTTSTSYAFPTGLSNTADQFAQVTLVNNLGSSSGLFLRYQSDTAHYIARHNGTNIAIIAVNATGVTTSLANANKTRVAGDKMRFVASGTVLSVYINDFTTPVVTYDTASDAAKYTGPRAGIRSAGNTGVQYDDFYAGNASDISQIGAPAPSTAPTVTFGTTTDTRQDLTISVVTGASGYLVEYKKSADSTWTTFVANTAGPTVQVTGLTAATSYDYRASARNAAGVGPASTVVTKSTNAAVVRTITVNTSPADGVPKWKGLTYGPSGRLILPGKPVHRMHADFFGPSGAYTPPSWLAVTGTATLTDSASSLTRLDLTTGNTVGSIASLALSPSVNSGSFFAIRIDVEAFSFTVQNPAANIRLGAAGSGSIGGGMIQTPADDSAYLYSGGETNVTSGVFSHLGENANQRRQLSVLVLNQTRQVFLLEDDMVLSWRDGTSGWTDGVVTPALSIETTSTAVVSARLASITFTLYA